MEVDNLRDLGAAFFFLGAGVVDGDEGASIVLFGLRFLAGGCFFATPFLVVFGAGRLGAAAGAMAGVDSFELAGGDCDEAMLGTWLDALPSASA